MFETALASRAEVLALVKEDERVVAAARARQIRHLRGLLRRRMLPRPDELASLLDVSASTARDLYEATQRTPELSPMMADLESGEWSFDRAAAIAHLRATGSVDQTTLEEAENRDIAGIGRLRAMQRRITRRSEHEAHEQRSLRGWPSLDSSAGFIDVQLAGADWQVVMTALDRRADELPRLEDATATQRRADALLALSHDYLDGRTTTSGRSAGHVVTVVIDPALAAATNGEAGAVIPGGPRVGPETLDEITCEGSVEVLVDRASGVPIAVGPTTRVVPPKVRRFVLARDRGCVVDGCNSRYRLEVHHIVPRSEHGTHDPENLVTLCWFHHHVAIHGRGMRIDPDSPPHRRRLVPAGRDP